GAAIEYRSNARQEYIGRIIVLQRERAEEAVAAREVVLDEHALAVAVVEAVPGMRAEARGAAVRRVGEGRLGVTDAEAAERQPGLVETQVGIVRVPVCHAAEQSEITSPRRVIGIVGLCADIGLQRAPLGLRTRVEVEAGANILGVFLRTVWVIAARITRCADLVEDVARDLEAGFRPRNIEEARTVDVADADVFDRFGLRRQLDHVRRLRAGHAGRQGRRGADEKALAFHVLTSSQNRPAAALLRKPGRSPCWRSLKQMTAGRPSPKPPSAPQRSVQCAEA